MREHWGLSAHQVMSPTLEQKLAFTATLTDSYEKASQMTANWSGPVEASVIHALVQRLGAKAEHQTQERLQQLPRETERPRAPREAITRPAFSWTPPVRHYDGQHPLHVAANFHVAGTMEYMTSAAPRNGRARG